MEKLIIIGESANFLSKPDIEDSIVRTVKKDEEFYITKVGKINGESWLKAYIDDSFEGYIKVRSKIAVILPVKLHQKECVVYQEPTTVSNQISVLRKKAKFNLINKTLGNDNKNKVWDKIKLQTGEFGYINSDTNVIPINKAEETRKKICLYLIILLCFISLLGYLSIFLSDVQNGGSSDSEDVALLFLGSAIVFVFSAFISYLIIEAISRIFKSKMEKYYYPDLYAIYENQIL